MRSEEHFHSIRFASVRRILITAMKLYFPAYIPTSAADTAQTSKDVIKILHSFPYGTCLPRRYVLGCL